MLGAIAFGIAIVALGALILEYWKFAVSIGILCVMIYFIYDRAVHSVIPLTDLNIYDITGNCDYRRYLAYCSLKATVANTSQYYLDSITVRMRVTDCQKGTSTCVNLDLDGRCAYFYTGEKADSHYCGPEVLDWCRASGLDYILGVAPTTTLRRHVESLEASVKARFEAAPRDGKLRRFKEFFDGAQSWSRVERIIARVEAGAEGSDTRFVVTNLNKRNARVLYEDVYCRRGQAENHIKSWKTHLAADRTSCTKATANQFRLFLHAGAYWLMWGLRASMPRRSMWRVAQFDTLRLRLVKIAARVVEMKTMIRVHLPTSCPGQEILRFALQRIPRLVT